MAKADEFLADNRLVGVFDELRQAGRKTLIPFITGGYPDAAATTELLGEFESRGVRICEVGFPFSDPIADGPVIQASYTQALAQGASTSSVLQAVEAYRRRGGKMALVAMISYSLVFRRSPGTFLEELRQAGLAGVIIPDLPLEEELALETAAGQVVSMAELAGRAGICNILLVAPTSAPRRQAEIARHSRGFIYYVSVAGITGERSALPAQTIAAVQQLRQQTSTPICVGFGISNARTVEQVCRVADGAIVGSAIVRRIQESQKAGVDRAAMVRQAGEFVAELLRPVDDRH
jgi:tryptophan synthase alpha chain